MVSFSQLYGALLFLLLFSSPPAAYGRRQRPVEVTSGDAIGEVTSVADFMNFLRDSANLTGQSVLQAGHFLNGLSTSAAGYGPDVLRSEDDLQRAGYTIFMGATPDAERNCSALGVSEPLNYVFVQATYPFRYFMRGWMGSSEELEVRLGMAVWMFLASVGLMLSSLVLNSEGAFTRSFGVRAFYCAIFLLSSIRLMTLVFGGGLSLTVGTLVVMGVSSSTGLARLIFLGRSGSVDSYRSLDWFLFAYLTGYYIMNGPGLDHCFFLYEMTLVLSLYCFSCTAMYGVGQQRQFTPTERTMYAGAAVMAYLSFFMVGTVGWLSSFDAADFFSRRMGVLPLALSSFTLVGCLLLGYTNPVLSFRYVTRAAFKAGASLYPCMPGGMCRPLFGEAVSPDGEAFGIVCQVAATLVLLAVVAFIGVPTARSVGQILSGRYERRRGSKPIPEDLTFAVDVYYVCLGMTPLTWCLQDNLPFTGLGELWALLIHGRASAYRQSLMAVYLYAVFSLSAAPILVLPMHLMFTLAAQSVWSAYGLHDYLSASRDAEYDALVYAAHESEFVKAKAHSFLSKLVRASTDIEGALGTLNYAKGEYSIGSGLLVTRGADCAIVTVQHCCAQKKNDALTLDGVKVRVTSDPNPYDAPSNLGPDPATGFRVSLPGNATPVAGPLRTRKPSKGETVAVLGIKSASIAKVTRVSAKGASISFNPLFGYSGRIVVAFSDGALVGTVSTRTMMGRRREGGLTFIDASYVNEQIGFPGLIDPMESSSGFDLTGFEGDDDATWRTNLPSFVAEGQAGLGFAPRAQAVTAASPSYRPASEAELRDQFLPPAVAAAVGRDAAKQLMGIVTEHGARRKVSFDFASAPETPPPKGGNEDTEMSDEDWEKWLELLEELLNDPELSSKKASLEAMKSTFVAHRSSLRSSAAAFEPLVQLKKKTRGKKGKSLSSEASFEASPPAV